MKQPAKIRLDQLIVERSLAKSRQKAQVLILAGEVTVNGQRAQKAGQPVAGDAAIVIGTPPPFVGRGGYKMQAIRCRPPSNNFTST
jgi:23S rRNA (cytidine1920-2'-O)/16S rRNA (cytidine1409-2'-O)-methyltransferase